MFTSSSGVIFDFSGSFFRFVFFSHSFNAILAFHISSRVSIYRSLISFAVSRPLHLVLHVILISSFITDVIAPPLRGASKRCNAFPSYAEKDFVVVSRSVWMSHWSNWMIIIFPFFTSSPWLKCFAQSWNIKLRVFNRLRSPARKTPLAYVLTEFISR